MTLPLAVSDHDYWGSRWSIGLAAALIVAALLRCSCAPSAASSTPSTACSRSPAKVAANTANIPQLEATAPVLGLIVEEAVVQDGYMNALTDGFGGDEHHDVLVLLSVVLALVVVAVLAAALIEVRRGLDAISEGLATLGRRAEGVEAEHLRPLEGAVKAINAQFDVILGALPGIARKAAIVAERRPR